MPRLTNSLPKYRKHRASGQAVVTLSGKDHYLGRYGTKASEREYDRLIGEWLAAGRRLVVTEEEVGPTIAVLSASYWKFAQQHYRKRDKGTSEIDNIRYALRPLKELYAATLVKDFGPLALKALQGRMIEDGLSRGVMQSHELVSELSRRLRRW